MLSVHLLNYRCTRELVELLKALPRATLLFRSTAKSMYHLFYNMVTEVGNKRYKTYISDDEYKKAKKTIICNYSK
jgi:hypothetical protein